MSIPRLLHSSFFGDWKFSDLNKRCFSSWEDKLPGWERMDWRWDNLPDELRNHHWVKAARNCQGRGAGSNAGAYIKFWLMHKYGGYYIDNDVEVLKEFPLDHGMVLAWQRDDMCPNDMSVNASVAGCEPGHWFCQEYLKRVEARPPCDFPLAFGPMLYTKILRERGLTGMTCMLCSILKYTLQNKYFRYQTATLTLFATLAAASPALRCYAVLLS